MAGFINRWPTIVFLDARYLLLDQSTPQTVIGGVPLLPLGIDCTSDTTTVNAANITGTCTPVVIYSSTSSSYVLYGGDIVRFRIYGYKTVGGVRIYSTNYIDSGEIDPDPPSLTPFYVISLAWTDNSANFDGYRILIYDPYNSFNYDAYIDVVANSTVYGDTWPDSTTGVTVTPNSVDTYDVAYPIITNGITGESGKVLSVGSDIEFLESIQGDVDILGALTVGGTTTLNGTTDLKGRTRFTGGIVADTLYGMNRLDIGVDETYGNPRFNLEDYRPDPTPVNTLWQIDNWYGSLRFLSQNANKVTFSLDRTSLGYWSAITLFKDNTTAGAAFYGNAHSSIIMPFECGRLSAYNITGMEKFNVYGNAWWERDNDKAIFGAGKDATILYDGTNMVINPKLVGTGVLKIAGNITPSASDGGALGTTALMWSDLFLASGAVINFNNGNFTLTHSAGKLTASGTVELDGDLDHDGTNIGFFGITPTTRQTELTDELTTITHTAPAVPDYAIQNLTNSSGYGFVTQDEGNTVLSVIANLQTRVNELETKLTAYGLLQDAD